MDQRVNPRARPKPLQPGTSDWGRRRVAAGLSQRQASQLSGIGRDIISRLESGRMIPKPEEAEKLLALYREHTPIG